MTSRYEAQNRRRRSLRLKGYDYTEAGAYFVTMVVQNRLCLFGGIVAEEMRLNEAGEMVRSAWESLPRRFPGIEVDAFVAMPNHVHGILVIDRPVEAFIRRAPARDAPTTTTLGAVVGAYKSLTAVEYARSAPTTIRPRLWQRNYYEHVIRNDESLNEIRQYICDNPAQWSFDRENPSAIRPSPKPIAPLL